MSDTDKDDVKPEPDKEPEKEPDTAKESDPAAEAAKWKALARKHEAQAKANAKAAEKLEELEDAKKSEIDRATDKVTQAEKRAAEAERRALQIEVALDKAPEGMAVSQVRKLAKRLAGDSREELEADAEELFTEFRSDKDDDGGDDDTSKRRPKEALKPGAAPRAKPEENDPKALADAVPPGW